MTDKDEFLKLQSRVIICEEKLEKMEELLIKPLPLYDDLIKEICEDPKT